MRWPTPAWSALAGALAGLLSLLTAGCLVQSRCEDDWDCDALQTCNKAQGTCGFQCANDQDCLQNGVYIGKECVDRQCIFKFDERVAAPNFCLRVANPKSSHYDQDLCLKQLKGKVVLLYFGWLT
jgi:hypothetical protein